MMGIRQVSNLGIALRERFKDRLRPGLPVDADKARHAQPLRIEMEGFHSELPFDPKLYHGWYKNLEQDVLDETGDPVLRTDFDYEGIVLQHGRILSDGVSHVSVFDAENQLQTDYTAHHRLKPAATLKRKPGRTIPGTTLHLCAPLATLQGNFAHWLLDGLARWVLLEDRAAEPLAIDQFLIPANMPHFRESLHVLGVSDEQIVELPIHEALEFERLVCISRPRGYSSNVAPGWLIDGYRQRLQSVMSPPEQANLRLYISRRDAGSRKFREEEALVTELEKRGFRTVELSRLGFQEKAELFSQASEVIGLAGAGMMSVMFCPPGARVIELYPSNFISYLFATIGAALGQEHHGYIFKNNSKRSLLSRHSGEFELDLTEFLGALDGWMEQPPKIRKS